MEVGEMSLGKAINEVHALREADEAQEEKEGQRGRLWNEIVQVIKEHTSAEAAAHHIVNMLEDA